MNFLNKNANTSKGLALEEGALNVCNKYEEFTVGPESIRRAKTPYFSKVSKIREVIYVTEGVFPHRLTKNGEILSTKQDTLSLLFTKWTTSPNVRRIGSGGPIFPG